MKFIFFTSDKDKFWIELDNDNYATRQIVLSDNEYHFSCIEDCLAEGKINDEDLSDDIIEISSFEFEDVWNIVLKKYNAEWNAAKAKYRINDFVIGNLKYYYPQGAIFKCDDAVINYVGKESVKLFSNLEMKIIGYDEINMWIVTV